MVTALIEMIIIHVHVIISISDAFTVTMVTALSEYNNNVFLMYLL